MLSNQSTKKVVDKFTTSVLTTLPSTHSHFSHIRCIHSLIHSLTHSLIFHLTRLVARSGNISMEKLFNKCHLRRCQGSRGCICPKKPMRSVEGELPPSTDAIGFAQLMKAVNDVPLLGQEVSSPTLTTRLPQIATAISSTSNKEPPSPSPPTTNTITKLVSPNKIPTTAKLVPLSKKSAVETLTTKADVTTDAAEDTVTASDEKKNNGKITIRFNHYKKQFDIIDGSLKAATIDDEYYITFAFPGAKIHLTAYGPSDFSFEEKGFSSAPLELEKPVGTFRFLEADKVYFVQVEEESKAKQEYEDRQEKKAAENAKKRAQQEAAEVDGLIITKTKLESCSCIEGNPCVEVMCCQDWVNRYEIANKFGWKGF